MQVFECLISKYFNTYIIIEYMYLYKCYKQPIFAV